MTSSSAHLSLNILFLVTKGWIKSMQKNKKLITSERKILNIKCVRSNIIFYFIFYSYHFNVAKKHHWPARSEQQSSDLFFIVTTKTSATPTLTENSWIWCVFEVTCLIMRKKTSSRVWTECLVDLAKKWAGLQEGLFTFTSFCLWSDDHMHLFVH